MGYSQSTRGTEVKNKTTRPYQHGNVKKKLCIQSEATSGGEGGGAGGSAEYDPSQEYTFLPLSQRNSFQERGKSFP